MDFATLTDRWHEGQYDTVVTAVLQMKPADIVRFTVYMHKYLGPAEVQSLLAFLPES